MGIVQSFGVRCDHPGCGKSLFIEKEHPSASIPDPVARAMAAGWNMDGGLSFCPEHYEIGPKAWAASIKRDEIKRLREKADKLEKELANVDL